MTESIILLSHHIIHRVYKLQYLNETNIANRTTTMGTIIKNFENKAASKATSEFRRIGVLTKIDNWLSDKSLSNLLVRMEVMRTIKKENLESVPNCLQQKRKSYFKKDEFFWISLSNIIKRLWE